jgi:hypothetical protein
MNDRIKSALIGGAILGILSAIPAVNYCCCIWALIGGIIAVNLYVKKSPVPVKPGDGAVLGAIAGAIGIAFIIVIGIPLNLLVGTAMVSLLQGMVPPDQAAQMNQMMAAGVGIASAIKSAVILSVVAVIFSALGGLIGVAIFEKRKNGAGAPPPPAPPINTADGPNVPGGPPGGGSYGGGM